MNVTENYLHDMLLLLLERGREARSEQMKKLVKADDGEAKFAAGRAMGYYEVLSTLFHQLDVYGISPASIGLPDNLNLDEEFLTS